MIYINYRKSTGRLQLSQRRYRRSHFTADGGSRILKRRPAVADPLVHSYLFIAIIAINHAVSASCHTVQHTSGLNYQFQGRIHAENCFGRGTLDLSRRRRRGGKVWKEGLPLP